MNSEIDSFSHIQSNVLHTMALSMMENDITTRNMHSLNVNPCTQMFVSVVGQIVRDILNIQRYDMLISDTIIMCILACIAIECGLRFSYTWTFI